MKRKAPKPEPACSFRMRIWPDRESNCWRGILQYWHFEGWHDHPGQSYYRGVSKQDVELGIEPAMELAIELARADDEYLIYPA